MKTNYVLFSVCLLFGTSAFAGDGSHGNTVSSTAKLRNVKATADTSVTGNVNTSLFGGGFTVNSGGAEAATTTIRVNGSGNKVFTDIDADQVEAHGHGAKAGTIDIGIGSSY